MNVNLYCIVVNEDLMGRTNLLFSVKLQSAFIKHEDRTLNTSFAYLTSVVLYVLPAIVNSVVITITIRFSFRPLQLNLLNLPLAVIPF